MFEEEEESESESEVRPKAWRDWKRSSVSLLIVDAISCFLKLVVCPVELVLVEWKTSAWICISIQVFLFLLRSIITLSFVIR